MTKHSAPPGRSLLICGLCAPSYALSRPRAGVLRLGEGGLITFSTTPLVTPADDPAAGEPWAFNDQVSSYLPPPSSSSSSSSYSTYYSYSYYYYYSSSSSSVLLFMENPGPSPTR
jgi:hypothetical protein